MSNLAQIGGTAHVPARKRRVAVVTDLPRRRLPVDELGLFGPESVTLREGAGVEIGVRSHFDVSSRVFDETEFIIMAMQLATG